MVMKNFINDGLLIILAGAAMLTWVGVAVGDQGQDLYGEKCSLCHGDDGKGKGPGAAAFNPGPADFTAPQFWQGAVPGKITNTVKNGKGTMEPVEASDSEINAIISYMERTFKP
jgi:mono/diheme cytochrome c family protein